MAHHNNTPASILSAPLVEPVTVSSQQGYSRSERRHGVYSPPKMTAEAKQQAHAEAVAAGPNKPAATSRVRKIRKGRKARFNRSES